MKENKILRVWQWSVMLLVVCNAVLLLTIWLKPHRGGPDGQRPRNYLISQLKFTDAQVQQYDVLIKEHQAAMKRLQKESAGYREQLFSGLLNTGGATPAADSLAQLIASDQKEIELVTYRHFAQVRTICTAEQKAGFDKIITEVIKIMGAQHGPPPPRRDDGQGPPPTGDPDGPPPSDGR